MAAMRILFSIYVFLEELFSIYIYIIFCKGKEGGALFLYYI